LQSLINNEEKILIAEQKSSHTISLQDKFDRLANLSVLHPKEHVIPDITDDMNGLMYWG